MMHVLKLSRRKVLLGGAALAAGVGALEYESLTGHFDHRRSPGAMRSRRYAESRVKLVGPAGDGAIVHVGHSTHLLSIAKTTFLTDPWFYDPAFGALSHVTGPAVSPEDIGELRCILVTHDHADHVDMGAIDRMDKRAIAIVATDSLAARFRSRGFAQVHVPVPWEATRVGEVMVTTVPGLHDIYEIGFVLQGAGRCVYFAGDTRLHPDLPAIAERFAPSCALLPVDGTRLTGGAMHVMTPDDAVVAARTLKVKLAIPSHGEARLSDPLASTLLASTIAKAPAKFAVAMKRGLPEIACTVPAAGELVEI